MQVIPHAPDCPPRPAPAKRDRGPERERQSAALDIGVPSGRITDILDGRRSITADTAVRLGLYFGNRPQLWLGLQDQYDIERIERQRGGAIDRQVRRPKSPA